MSRDKTPAQRTEYGSPRTEKDAACTENEVPRTENGLPPNANGSLRNERAPPRKPIDGLARSTWGAGPTLKDDLGRLFTK
jgi:hypothetical protein